MGAGQPSPQTFTSIDENELFWQRLVEEDQAAEAQARTGAVAESGSPAAKAASEEELTFEEAVADLSTAVTAMPRLREMYLKLLEFCQVRRSLEEAEREIEGYPEFPYGAQPPYRLIRTMVDHGGLEWIELSENGTVVTSEDKAGLTDDEADDLVAGFAVLTTAVGEQVREDFAPERRLRSLFEEHPHRTEAYLDVMDFCRKPRAYQEVRDLLQGRDVLSLTRNADGQPLQPSFFVDMLERSGGLVWNGGWKVTKQGEALLSRMAKASA